MSNVHTFGATATAIPPSHFLLSPRIRRIWLLMFAIWMMNAFDLSMTIQAHQQGFLVESNPIAHAILPHGPTMLAVFKILLVSIGSYILLTYRQHAMVECVAWALTLIYVGVCVQWIFCYDAYEIIVSYGMQDRTQPFLGMVH